MLGRAPGFGVEVVLMEGAEGSEKRDDDAAGDKCSPDDSEEFESTEKRAWDCA